MHSRLHRMAIRRSTLLKQLCQLGKPHNPLIQKHLAKAGTALRHGLLQVIKLQRRQVVLAQGSPDKAGSFCQLQRLLRVYQAFFQGKHGKLRSNIEGFCQHLTCVLRRQNAFIQEIL